MWREVLHKETSIQNARWPSVPPSDPALTAAREYVKATTSNITSSEAQAAKRMAKGKAASFDPRKPKRITIFAATAFPAWQDKYVDLVRDMLSNATLEDDKAVNGAVAKLGKGPEMKKAMPFVQGLKRRIVAGGEKPDVVFERKLPFSEVDYLHEIRQGLMKTTGCKDVVVTQVSEDNKASLPPQAEAAVPGHPSFMFENIEA